jgi:ring-1,2-phenylacetyl-CoA epoxidase subunit PaaE
VKKIEGGLFSGFVNDALQAGDTLEVMQPNGSFFVAAHPDMALHYVAFAAGSGITPVFSMLKTHLELEPKARFSLFYINQTVASIILKEEIEALKNKYLDRFDAYFFLTQEEQETSVFNGRIDREKLEEICRYFLEVNKADHFFLCGPEPMIFMIRDFLKEKGVDEQKIHFELFHSFAGQAKIEARKQQKMTGGLVEILLKEGGKTIRFQMAKGGESLLDAALKRNSALPFACKGGVCCTCKARLMEGKVQMDVNYALEKEQLDAGYILTCQAFPLTDKVLVDFDQ